MPAFALTAAEIAAAEAAAIAAAEAAAVQAAQVAAAEAAAQAAATAAAEQAAAQAASATATNAATNQSVLNAVGAGGGAPASAAQMGGYGGINSIGAGAGTGGISNLGFQTLAQEVGATGGIETLLSGLNTPSAVTSMAPMAPPPMAPPPMAPMAPPPIAPPPPPMAPPPMAPPPPPIPDVKAGMDASQITNIPPASPPPQAPAPVNPPPQDRMLNYGMETQGMKAPLNQTATYNLTGPATPPAPEPNFLQSAFKDFKDMPLKDKLLTGLMGSTGYEMLTRPKPKEKEKYKSTWNADAYSGYDPTPPTPYKPRYAVGGGISDLGGFSDYARGGRMLKGPGDGMSDEIPATIADKQPARLANEEFVIPADVVSHLGNGSSEAGAKVLYKMMDRVRKARTGTKKQGKQINPEKYLA